MWSYGNVDLALIALYAFWLFLIVLIILPAAREHAGRLSVDLGGHRQAD